MNKAGRIFAYLLRKLWVFSAVVLVLFALFMSFLRYGLPYADSQRSHIENWLSAQVGTDVHIGGIDAGWQANGPALIIRNLSLATQQQGPVKVTVGRTYIDMDFWASLRSARFVSTRFSLHDMQVELLTDRPSSDDSELSYPSALQDLFLQQLKNFSVVNGQVQLIGNNHSRTISIGQLSWLNQGERHQGVGQFSLDQLSDSSASFILDLHGQPADLSGTLFVDGRNINVAPWLQQLAPDTVELAQSDVNLQVWAEVQQSKVQDVLVKWLPGEISWQGQMQSTLAVETGEFIAKRFDTGWLLNLSNLQYHSDNYGAGVIQATGRIDTQGRVTLHANDIAIKPLIPLLGLAGANGELLTQLDPNGNITEISLQLDAEGPALFASVADLQVNEWHPIPGGEQLTSQVAWQHGLGHIIIEGQQGQLKTQQLFGHDLIYKQVLADLWLQRQADGLRILPSQLSVDSSLLQLHAQASWQPDGLLQISADLQPHNVINARQLFPGQLMGQHTVDYLNRALVSGDITSSKLIWFGRPADYPFAQGQGIFQSSVAVKDSEFLFDADWPALTQLDMNLLFENAALQMRANKGNLMQVAMTSLQADIPDLSSDGVLTIEADTRTDAGNVTSLMQASPLAHSVGATLTQIQLSGDVSTRLHLTIPFADDSEVVASGEVSLDNTPIGLQPLSVTLTEAVGSIRFRNDVVQATDLKANLFGEPIVIDLKTFSAADGYHADASIDANWDLTRLLTSRYPGLASQLGGSASGKATFNLLIPEEGFSYQFSLLADLSSATSAMPAPFDLADASAQKLVARVNGDQQASQLTLQLGEDVHFEGVLPHAEARLSRAHLSIGRSDVVTLGAGFSISANLASMDVQAWFNSLYPLIDQAPQSEGESFIGVPQRIFVNVSELQFAGQHLHDVASTVKWQEQAWNVDVRAREAIANVQLFHNWLEQGLKINADYLNLSAWEGGEQAPSKIDISKVPPMQIVCQRCIYADNDLGQIQLTLSRAEQGMRIEKLDVQQAKARLTASGRWFLRDGEEQTELEGNFYSKDFGAFLAQYEVNSGIRDSDANMNFALNWQQAPHEFNFASLNGSVDWKLGDGYLAEVSDRGARLFSILSLESLVRKLKLDFRDVFAKGFFYEKMTGTFLANNGTVSTDNTRVDGGAGEISLTGYTDLNDQALNYRISFRPKVTSSLPVIVAWMVNPATAVAALAINQMIDSAEVISSIDYSLTGSISEPVLTELKRDSKNIQIPAKVQPKPAQPIPATDSGVNQDG